MSVVKDKVEELEIEKQIELLRHMQEAVEYQLDPIPENALLSAFKARFPWLNKLLPKEDPTKLASSVGGAITKIGEQANTFQTSTHAVSVAQGFHFGSIALAAVEVIRIPLMILAAYLLGVKISITLDEKTKWIFSGVLLGLFITALAVPVTAPVIGFVATGLALVVSLYALGKTLFDRYQLGKEKRHIKKELEREEDAMELIRNRVKLLEDALSKTKDKEQITAIYQEIAVIQEEFNSQKKIIGELKNKEFRIEQNINQLGALRIMDRTVGVILGAFTVSALIVTLFNPIGAVLVASAAVLGGAYLAARLATPLLVTFAQWISKKIKGTEQLVETVEKNQLDNTLSDSNEITADHELLEDKDRQELADNSEIHESTASVFIGLLGKERAIESLQKGYGRDELEESRTVTSAEELQRSSAAIEVEDSEANLQQSSAKK